MIRAVSIVALALAQAACLTATRWTELHLAMVFGAIFAAGFGVAGGALLVAGIEDGDAAEIGQGAAFLGGAVAGAGLATYGVVTYLLATGAPTKQALAIVEE